MTFPRSTPIEIIMLMLRTRGYEILDQRQPCNGHDGFVKVSRPGGGIIGTVRISRAQDDAIRQGVGSINDLVKQAVAKIGPVPCIVAAMMTPLLLIRPIAALLA